jgi:secreted trypsin-like serine protease
VPIEKHKQLAHKKEFDCVGQIFMDDESIGSCVLVNQRFVLTAAHVCFDSETRKDTVHINGHTEIHYVPYQEKQVPPSELVIVFGKTRMKATRIILHPSNTDSISQNGFDLALIELEKPIRSILPASINSKTNELNAHVTGVGFGASGVANKPQSVSLKDEKMAGENVVDSIGGQIWNGNETTLFCDFDHPTRTGCNKMGSAIPQPLEYTCSGGDSGGGLFRKKGSRFELIGICSGMITNLAQFKKTGYYGQIMEWTRISVFSKWIADNLH